MTWLNLMPDELQQGDQWDDGQIVDSVEPVESAMECRIVFADETSIIWPWRAPRRVFRPEEWEPGHEGHGYWGAR